MKKKLVSILLAGTFVMVSLAGCGSQGKSAAEQVQAEAAVETTEESTEEAAPEEVAEQTEGTPKYVFLFIGDGMSYPQIQLTNYYANTMANQGNEKSVSVEGEDKTVLTSENKLNMMNFDVSGSAQTYDSTSFAPDSASTATSIATGNKT